MRATGLETLPEVDVVEAKVFEDERGVFYESWNSRAFAEAIGERYEFVQDNHSESVANVLRGLHYQLPPHPQGKLVRVVSGAVYDVAVDIRRSSHRFGRWAGLELSETNRRMLWVPPGFAHGFRVLSDSATLLYKTTAHYVPKLDRAIRWNDPEIGIDWPGDESPILSDKDAAAPRLRDAEVFP